MAKIFHDSVAQTSNSTGTGDFTLSTTTTYLGRRTLQSVPGLAVGDTFAYRIALVDADGQETGVWETGEGTYVSANTVRRTSPQAGSAGAATLVNFGAGTKKFTLTVNAADMRWLAGLASGCTINRGTDGYITTVVENGITYTFNWITVAGLKRLGTVTGGGKTWTMSHSADGRSITGITVT
jgi:hypothetical protein